MPDKKTIISGVAPSGNIHLGNYLGAVKNWVDMQDDFNAIFFIVDMHAITMPRDPQELHRKILEVSKMYLAAGIDPKKSTVFIQSHLPQHAELMWILNTITKTGELSRMTQFKDKAELSTGDSKAFENVPLGIFNYPVLMAADILLYDVHEVPVGEDQIQHIELTRDLGKRFNERFGQTFVIPKATVRKAGGRIMGLDDPTKKMSKSANSEYNYLSLLDSEAVILKKIKKAVTDSGSEIVYTDEKPAIKNLLNIYSLLSGKPIQEIELTYQGKGYGDFKMGLAEVVINFIKPFQEKYNSISDEEVLGILKAGAEKLFPIAEKKMREVKEKIGFVL